MPRTRRRSLIHRHASPRSPTTEGSAVAAMSATVNEPFRVAGMGQESSWDTLLRGEPIRERPSAKDGSCSAGSE